MSRPYYHRRTYRDGNDAAFAITILLVCAAWTHKELMVKVEHIAVLGLIIGCGGVGLVAIYRVISRVRLWKLRHTPDMAAIDSMTGLEFEHYIARLLKFQGYSHVRLTEEYDYGVDIVAVKGGVTWGIQVKRYSGLVKADAVRQVVTALKKYRCDRAMVITNSTYSRVAKELAKSNNCRLLDRTDVIHWML